MLHLSAAYFVTPFALLAAMMLVVARCWRNARQASAKMAELKAERTLFQSLLDSSPNAVLVVSHEHRILKVSEPYARLCGVSTEDLIGKPLVHSHTTSRFLDLGGLLELTLLRMDGNERSDLITLGIPEQSVRTFRVNATQCRSEDGVFSGTAIVLTDISEQVAAQHRVDQTSAAMDDITDALSVTFFQLCRESNGHIWLPWVKGMQNTTLNWSAERMMRDGGGILPNLDASEKTLFIGAVDQSIATQQPMDVTVRLTSDNRWVHIASGNPRVGPNGATLWYAYAMDVTEMQRYNTLLATASREAEAATEAKSRFLATMSHEIRTPLATVIASLDLLRESELSTHQREELDLADHSAKLLLEILGDILDFSRIEAGEMKLEQAPIDLRLIIEDVLRIQARQIEKKGVILDFYVEAGLAATLLGDAVRLRQIVLNLVGNATKFTLQGSIVVRALLIADHPETQTIQLEVSDTGIGIPAEKQAALFKAFSQADVSTTRRFGGSGLGLSICSRLVQAMGGAVVLTSTPGVGSTFRVELTLPVVERSTRMVEFAKTHIAIDVSRADDAAVFREHAVALGMQLAPLDCLNPSDIAVIDEDAASDKVPVGVLTIPYGKKHGNLSGPPIWWSEFRAACLDAVLRDTHRFPAQGQDVTATPPISDSLAGLTSLPILVAEDHTPFQIVIRRQIEKLGLACDVVSDGKEALAAIRNKQYGMILTDCHMPYMDGYELTSAIRASEAQGQRLPIVALSADASDEQRHRGRAAGMDDFLLKPLKLPELRACIQRWVLR
ncbi:hybrid sensor histidine kinase/response regulator [Cupriavidus metallidurans]|uniref:Virulence sensor protein BvgS n=1 Tax=Cupriavidus metallidurans (strain ATCC 43123 / DSM 2839 / NBRC 102507 / CH34) TaxID=266264 RepID=Q1LB93_CUPMC|nr:ATP-binding protein [Cupriavidus metallidurans]ABF12583.1 sensor protein, histidine kinase-response regulator [Cupriavidus metallidurans CH34]QGS32211.1 response regulator [Cupriavidus metallidurans]